MDNISSHKVLPFGARVVVVKVDMHGYCGRDLHPQEEDVGFHGAVVQNTVMGWTTSLELQEDWGDEMNFQENVTPGTEFISGDREWYDIMYTVIAPDGRKLELMEHEIETLPSLVS